jgi:hypothetical protein
MTSTSREDVGVFSVRLTLSHDSLDLCDGRSEDGAAFHVRRLDFGPGAMALAKSHFPK